MIPAQQSNGALPPFVGSDPTVGPAVHSPYTTTSEAFAARFGTSAQRVQILRGWLEHRAALHALGFTGYQWVGGSYCEIMPREPNDIDVVTFFRTALNPVDLNGLLGANPDVFDPGLSKRRYRCDAYFVRDHAYHAHIPSVRFWYALFSHRRDRSWKGMLEIVLDPAADVQALAVIGAAGVP